MVSFWKKKPTEFDKDQDKVLQALISNQAILVKNNDFFIKDSQALHAEIQSLEKRLSELIVEFNRLVESDQDIDKRVTALEKNTTSQNSEK